MVNQFPATGSNLKGLLKKAKQANHTADYTAEYALLGSAFYFLFLSGLNVFGS